MRNKERNEKRAKGKAKEKIPRRDKEMKEK
jgi:hypothetical protein